MKIIFINIILTEKDAIYLKMLNLEKCSQYQNYLLVNFQVFLLVFQSPSLLQQKTLNVKV